MKNSYVIKKTFLSFVAVSVISTLAATAGMLIDNIIVGQFLGREALGAMAVISPISLVFSAAGNICAGGGTAMMAQAIGRGRYEEGNHVFTVTVGFSALMGILLTVGGLLFTPQIAAILGNAGETELMRLSAEYMRGFFLGAIPTLMLTTLMGFVKLDGSAKMPLYAIITMSGANIVLDLMMVLVFHQGMFGMALATSISYTLAALVTCTHFLKKSNTLRLMRPEQIGSTLGVLLKTGMPTAISRICDTIKNTVLNNLLLTAVGTMAVSAMSIRSSSENLLGALILGMGQALVPVAGVFYGEEDRTAVKDTLKTTLGVGLCLNGIAAVLLFMCPGIFASLLGMGGDPEILSMANLAVRIFAVSMPIRMVNYVLMNFYQSTQKTGFATAICVMQSLLYTVAAALILIRVLGATGVWLSFFIGEVCTFVTTMALVGIKTRRMPFSLDALLMLKDDFGGKKEDRLEISIGNSMEEVMLVSEGIHKFAKSRNIDKKTMDHAALFIEEMAGNIVQHAFKPGEERWFDIMLMDKPDHLLMRLRDNGDAFNPFEFLKGLPEEQREKYIGIRLVQALADKVEYRRSIGLNNVIITLKKEI